jgi:hypothetical protein
MKSIQKSFVLFCCLALACAQLCRANDLSSQYRWKPVRIGGGGWVVGMVVHPLDGTIRYARTDVGSAYRWDETGQQWIPMRVSNPDGSGILSAAATSAPASYGEDSVAVDPSNTNVVYMVFPTLQSCDLQCPTNYVEIYKSVDGGQNFTPGKMTAAAILGNPNGTNRMYGEKLMVDPANPAVLYYGSDSQGLWRSLDDGTTWKQFTGAAAPPANVEFINIQFARGPGTVTVNGVLLSKTVYAVSIQNADDTGGDVYQSKDGGQTWTDISTGIADAASGEALSHQALSSSIDATDALYVAENGSTNGYHRAFWKYAGGKWARFLLEASGVNFINQPVVSVAADPTNAQRIYALGSDTSLARSDDGGATWINLGAPIYANTLGWLPQTVGMSGGQWHSNGGLKVDAEGNLWTPTGQEGPLTIAAAAASAAAAANPPKWTISTTGIEELVAQDIAIPPGSNDTVVAAAMDTTGFVIPNPDNFSAVQIPLQQEIIAQGTSVAYAPDTPSYLAVTSSNVYSNGPNYSGYSADGGKTWNKFGAALKYACGTSTCDIPAGIVAVSVRGTRALGSDHIVLYPPNGLAPEYSLDGGATWHVSGSFPLNADGMTINSTNYSSFTYPQLRQHSLKADPFTADKFYLKFTHAPNSLYISTDGGVTWQGQAGANLPDWTWNGQLAVNSKVKNDLWYVDGIAGASTHGVFHSTDGGQTFQQIAGISHAISIAVGAGSGNAADAAYAVYFYGQLSSDPQWGIFRSTNGGATWDRVSYYPLGLYDNPATMAASQDTFGKVYVGFDGDSFVYGVPISSGAAVPGAPSALKATAISGTEIDLAWLAPSGAVTGYNVYRGTASGAETATALATGLTSASYADTSVSSGKAYFYTVTAVNSVGEGAQSNEAGATATQPSISLSTPAGSATAATVTAGQTAAFQFTLVSSNYTGTVTFACSGAPAGDTCTVPSPVSITPAVTSTTVNVSVQTAKATASRTHGRQTRRYRGGMLMEAGVVCLLLGFLRKRASLLMGLIGTVLLLTATGCGGGGAVSGTSSSPPPVVSTMTVSVSGPGVATVTETLTLTVQ